MKGRVDAENETAERVAKFYAELVIKPEPTSESEARDVIREIEKTITETDTALETAKKGCFLDVRRLCGTGKAA